LIFRQSGFETLLTVFCAPETADALSLRDQSGLTPMRGDEPLFVEIAMRPPQS